MSFKIGDHVILIALGNAPKNMAKHLGHSFVVESKLEAIPENGGSLMHQLGPKQGEFWLWAEPRVLMKIDPPRDMRKRELDKARPGEYNLTR